MQLRTLRRLFVWERDLTRSFLNIAIPIIIQSLMMASLHIVDNVMIGNLGQTEMEAVTQANRLTFLFQLTVFGLSGATSIFVSQFWGKRELKAIRQVQGLSMMVASVIAVLFLTLATVFPHLVMRALTENPLTAQYGAEYLRIVGIGYLFQALTQMYATVQKSTEHARLPMAGSITAILTNTLLNYMLIFGKFGMPRLGVAGGAIATMIATIVEFLIVCIGGYVFKLQTAARPRELLPPSRAFVAKYFRVTMPVVFNECLWAFGILMYSVVYGRMQNGTVASISIYNTVEQVAFAFSRGVVHTCAVLVGKRIGAGDEQDAYLTSERMMAAAFVIAGVAGGLLACTSTPIVHLFGAIPEGTRLTARTLIRLNALFMPLNAIVSVIIVGIMRAGGDVKYSLVLDAGSVWFVGVPLVFLGGLLLKWPITYVFLLSQVECMTKLVFGLHRFRSRKWIHNLVRDA